MGHLHPHVVSSVLGLERFWRIELALVCPLLVWRGFLLLAAGYLVLFLLRPAWLCRLGFLLSRLGDCLFLFLIRPRDQCWAGDHKQMPFRGMLLWWL